MSNGEETEDLVRIDEDDEERLLRKIREDPEGLVNTEVEEFAQLYLDRNETDLVGKSDTVIDAHVTAATFKLAAETGLFDEATINDNRFLIQRYFEKIAEGSGGYTPGPSRRNTHRAADPVSMFDGEFDHQTDDLRIDGAGMDFVFRRSYRSRVVFDGPLGANWDHNYDLHLHVTEAELVLTTGELREQRYARHPEHDYFVPPDGIDAVVEPVGDSFERRAADGTRHVFTQVPSTTAHRLDRVEDRFGNFLQFVYRDDEGGLLDHVLVNHEDRSVHFSYDSRNRIEAITDFTGRTWRYSYDDLNDLVAVTTPSTDRYPDGLTTCYEYSTAGTTGRLQHNLTRIIDAEGQLYLENEYGTSSGQRDFNRVIRQRQGGGEATFEYESVIPVFEEEYTDSQRPAHQTTMVDRNGHPVHYVYNESGNLLFKEEQIIEDGLPRTLTERYRYNRDGQLLSSMSPEGVVTQHLYGREAFLRREGIPADDDDTLSSHPNLTAEDRLGFGRRLVTVHRGREFDRSELDLDGGVWGDVFPDTLAQPEPEDAITKFTYEPSFGQPSTVSNPRFTSSPDPSVHTEATGEHPRYQETLTRYTYRPHPDILDSDANLLLDEIRRPSPTRPDGSVGEPVVETYEAYDERGRLQRRVDADGVVTTTTYFGENDDVREGHPQRTVVDPDGLAVTTEHEVDHLGRVVATRLPRSVDAPDGHFVTRNEYNDLDQITKTIESEPFNFETRRFYTRNGNLEREERDATDETGAALPGAPEVRVIEYDEELNPIRESTGGVDPSGHLVTRHCYNSSGERTLTILPGGNRLRYAYDERLLKVAETSGVGTDDAATTRTEFDGDGRVARRLDARGNPTTYTLDTFGRVIAEEDPLGHVVWRTYDQAGNTTVERMFEARDDDSYFLLARTETGYDELNRPIRVGVNRFDIPQGPVQKDDVEEAFVDGPGPGHLVETKTFYDVRGRVERTVDPLERETAFEYDELDRVVAETDPLDNRVENHYDPHDNLVRSDRLDRVRDSETGEVVGERVFSTSYGYDELDRLVARTDSLGNVTEFAYDSRGNETRRTDPLGNVVRTEFDLHNRRVTERRERTDTGLGTGNALDDAITGFEYDDNGNVTAVVDPLGRRLSYTFDALDRHRSTGYPDGTEFTFDYDPDGNLIHTEDNNGLRRHRTVDELGRTTRVDVDDSDLGNLQIGGATFEEYAYDGLGRRLHEENDFVRCETRFDSLGWPIEERTTFTTADAPLETPFLVQREFDDVGALSDVTYPNGRQLHVARDGLDRLTGVHNVLKGADYPGDPATPDDHDIVEHRAYAGRLRLRTHFGNGTGTTYAHDGAGRLFDIDHVNQAESLLRIQYLFDAVNNVRSRNDIEPSGSLGEVFAYDSIYRLVNVEQQDEQPFDPAPLAPSPPPPPDQIPDRQAFIDSLTGSLELPSGSRTFEYDLVGNRDAERTNEGGTIEYASNELDQYVQREDVTAPETTTTDYDYDENGNLTGDGDHTYVYDSLNRLVRVEEENGGGQVARFRHDARGRRMLEIVGGETTQLIYGGENVLAEFRDGQLFAQYVHGGMDQPLQIAADGNEYWYHTDLVGSVRTLTDADGEVVASYRYSPFGTTDDGSENSIYNPLRYTARRLDHALSTYDYRARQYNPDLGRFLQRDPDGPVDGTNLYSYVANNPLSYGDPSGAGRVEFAKPEEGGMYDDLEHGFDQDLDPFVDAHLASEAAELGLPVERSLLATIGEPLVEGVVATGQLGYGVAKGVVKTGVGTIDALLHPGRTYEGLEAGYEEYGLNYFNPGFHLTVSIYEGGRAVDRGDYVAAGEQSLYGATSIGGPVGISRKLLTPKPKSAPRHVSRAAPTSRLKDLPKWGRWSVNLAQAIKGEGLVTYVDDIVRMPKAVGRQAANKAGYLRDRKFYFTQLNARHGKYFSDANKVNIERGLAPIVDDQWIRHHPSHVHFKGEKLEHHHLGKRDRAVALPQSVHRGAGWKKAWHE